MKARFVFSNCFSENRDIYEIMWKDIVEWGRPQIGIWRMRIACWIPNATSTHSEYVILSAFSLQHWLREPVSTLRHPYIPLHVLLRIVVTSDREIKNNISLIDVFRNITAEPVWSAGARFQ